MCKKQVDVIDNNLKRSIQRSKVTRVFSFLIAVDNRSHEHDLHKISQI